MKKKDFITLVMSTVGGILFALGMCMALIPEWAAMTQGIVIGAVGAVVLLAMVLVRRKMSGKPAIVFNGKAIGITLLGVFGIAAVAVAYPVYSRITKKEREKLAPQILKLTEELSKPE